MATLSELKAFVQRILQDSSFDDDIVTYLNQAQTEIAGGMQSALGDWITPPLPELLTITTITTSAETAAYITYSGIKTAVSVDDILDFTYNDVEIAITITGDYSTLQDDIDAALILNDFNAEDLLVSWNSNDLILTCNSDEISSDTLVDGSYTDIDTLEKTTSTDTVYVETLSYVNTPTNFHRELSFASASNGAEIDIANSFISFVESSPLLNKSGTVYEIIEQGNKIYYQNIPSTSETLTIHYYRKPTEMSLDTDEPDGIPKHLQKELLINHACWKIFELIEDGIEGPGVNTQRYMELFYRALKVLELTIPYPTRGINLNND